MILLEELKSRYDSVNIGTIEEDCKNAKDISSLHRRDFILRLYYLERTSRFKENKVYENATFEKYIMNMFSLRYSMFNKERFAFIAHPVATAKWGAGLIDRIKTECGAGKLTEVIQAIEDTPNISYHGIEKIIANTRKPKTKTKPKPEANITESKRELEKGNAKKMKMIAEYIQTINEQTVQIERMKDTINNQKAAMPEHPQPVNEQTTQIERMQNTILMLQAENESLKAENDYLKIANESLRRQLVPSFMRDVHIPYRHNDIPQRDIHV